MKDKKSRLNWLKLLLMLISKVKQEEAITQ